MDKLVVYGSEECMGWTELQQVLEQFQNDGSVEVPVEIKDPVEYEEEFRSKGLVVCPSILYRDELIVVGIPTVSELKEKIHHSLNQREI